MTQRRQSKIPRRLNDAVVLENVGHITDINSNSDFRQDIFYCILDCMIAELERRFGDQWSMIITAIQAFNPKDASFIWIHWVVSWQYRRHCTWNLSTKRVLERSKADKAEAPSTVLELANFLEPYKMAFLELHRLLIISLVLPVSSASSERTFSLMRLIKSHVRTTMCDSRLHCKLPLIRPRHIDIQCLLWIRTGALTSIHTLNSKVWSLPYVIRVI